VKRKDAKGTEGGEYRKVAQEREAVGRACQEAVGSKQKAAGSDHETLAPTKGTGRGAEGS
jgi:hypothetical protein